MEIGGGEYTDVKLRLAWEGSSANDTIEYSEP
jgi:hypothetical protein